MTKYVANEYQLFSFGQTVAISIQWRNVAGQQLLDLSTDDRVVYQKVTYTLSLRHDFSY